MTSTNETILDTAVAAAQHARVTRVIKGSHQGAGRRIGIVCGKFNGGITTRLLTGSLDVLLASGVRPDDIVIAWVPGAFEVPIAAKRFAASGYDAVITLGAVIRGDTGHYDVVAGECARGVQNVQIETGVPVVFGVLTTNTVDQALERSLPDHTNKGRESAETALEMISVLGDIASSS